MKALLIAAALFLPAVGLASVMLARPIESMAQEADVVARGTVTGTESRLTADGRRIMTLVTVEVREAWKGAPARTVTIQTHGGSYGGIQQVVAGEAAFVKGQDVVVFLHGLSVPSVPAASLPPGPVFRVVGMAQGKLDVKIDPTLGEVAAPDLRGLELAQSPGGPVTEAQNPPPVPLSQLRARVQAALAP